MEQTRTGDGRHQGPRAGERGEGPGGGGLEDGCVWFFFVVSCLCRRGLHGCMVAPSASRCVLSLDQVRRRSSLASQLRGWWWPAAGLRQAQALPWPMGDAARPERRDGGPGLRGTRGKKQSEKKLDADCIVLNGDTEGSSTSCLSSNRGYLIRELASGNGFGVYGLGGPDCIPKSAALQQVEQQWLTSSVCSLTAMLVTGLDI